METCGVSHISDVQVCALYDEWEGDILQGADRANGPLANFAIFLGLIERIHLAPRDIIGEMGQVVHISEAEAARDLPALIDRALAGEEVVLCRSGRDIAVLSAAATANEAMRPLGEILDALKQRKAVQGLASVDDELAEDMRTVREQLNVPLDSDQWE